MAKSLEISFNYIAKANGLLTIFLIAQEIENQDSNITTEVQA